MRLHVTNWASRRLHHARRWTIMALPRHWEFGEGSVPALVPPPEVVRCFKDDKLPIEQARELYLHTRPTLTPLWADRGGGAPVRVQPGDTLLCCCARSAALLGACHRVWAAELLRREGWEVQLDGRLLKGVTSDWQPIF